MTRSRAWQAGANAATAANALLGVGGIAYALAGNKLFGLMLVLGAIGFDGLDGMLHRRGGGPATLSGRVLDSCADAVSFGIAPGVFVAVHLHAASAFAPYALVAVLVGAEVTVLALARLVYFTLRGFAHPFFVGASTPQTTIALGVLLLLFDEPGYFGANPLALLLGAALLAPLMVAPIPFPKMRRGARLRPVMVATALAFAVALVPAQFVPAPGSGLYLLDEGATLVAAGGVALYYLLGPWTARSDARSHPDPPSPP